MNQPEPATERPERGELPTLFPSDHVRMIVELLRPAGPELGRRWLAALLLVPEAERVAVVEAIEAKLASTYGRPHAPGGGERTIVVRYPPVQREGYVEETERTYSVEPPKAARKARRRDDA